MHLWVMGTERCLMVIPCTYLNVYVLAFVVLYQEAILFNTSYRYIADVSLINNTNFSDLVLLEVLN